MSLKNLRQKIDKIDAKVVALLNLRTKIAAGISRVKTSNGQSLYSPDREAQVLRRISTLNKGPLPLSSLQAIYREIMSSALAQGRPLSIAYLGPEATFTHLAALKRFGTQLNYIPCKSIADVFLEVEKGGVDYGVVPVENSIEGAVSHSLDMFVDSELKICAQIILDVSHNLLSKYTKDKIKRIYSIGQVFGQCRLWLTANLPDAELIEVSSTTRAAQIARVEKNSAAIASLLAAKIYKLKVVARDIEDSPHNITRFLVIGSLEPSPTGMDKTSILFSIKDKVGALYEMLSPFRKYKINLTKIESRPSKKKAWDYYFFVDLEGHREEPRVMRALAELEKKCTFMKVLGSYPVGE